MIDHYILGDNQFFGVNHKSRIDGEEKMRKFDDTATIIRLLKHAQEQGLGGLMLSSHERAQEITKAIQKESSLKKSFNLYPNIPYIIKYVQQITRDGLIRTAASVGKNSIPSIVSGGVAFMTKDFRKMMETAIAVELSIYKGTGVKAVFLHNGIVDLMLGLGMLDVFEWYDDYIRNKIKAIPGYGTMNLVKLGQTLHKAGIESPLIMAPFNHKGFHMNPSQDACETAIKKFPMTLLAMNIFASGASEPETAIEYIGRFPQIKNIIIGASSEKHILENRKLLKQHIGI